MEILATRELQGCWNLSKCDFKGMVVTSTMFASGSSRTASSMLFAVCCTTFAPSRSFSLDSRFRSGSRYSLPSSCTPMKYCNSPCQSTKAKKMRNRPWNSPLNSESQSCDQKSSSELAVSELAVSELSVSRILRWSTWPLYLSVTRTKNSIKWCACYTESLSSIENSNKCKRDMGYIRWVQGEWGCATCAPRKAKVAICRWKCKGQNAILTDWSRIACRWNRFQNGFPAIQQTTIPTT